MTVARLHVPETLEGGVEIRLLRDRAHYLRHVLRLREGGAVRLFNEADGEWQAKLVGGGRHDAVLAVEKQMRPAAPEPGPTLVFAPIRRNRLDWLIEKAVELGVERLVPVITQRTVVKPENADRLEVIAREAAEQCERLTLPSVAAPLPLTAWLAARDPGEPVLAALTRTTAVPIASALRRLERMPALVIGPEGGLAPEERDRLLVAPAVQAVSLGPLILRAETAALAMLAAARLLQAGEAG